LQKNIHEIHKEFNSRGEKGLPPRSASGGGGIAQAPYPRAGRHYRRGGKGPSFSSDGAKMDGEPLREGFYNHRGTQAPHLVEGKGLEICSQRGQELPLLERVAAGGL